MSEYCKIIGWFMVLNATFNNISVISWRSVLLVEDIAKCKANVFLYIRWQRIRYVCL